MKALVVTAVASIALGVFGFILSAAPAKDPFSVQKSFGYIPIVLGLVTLAIAIFRSRRSKAIALLISGMVLVLLGEQLPQLIFRTVFGSDAGADYREAGFLFLILGAACVVACWVILVLDAKSAE